MEPPSPALAAALRDLGLASPADLRRAARSLRSLARDLPTFDSVWIDALVRLRRITPFQAAALHDGTPARLRVAGRVLTARLGGETFRGVAVGGAPVAVAVIRPSADRTAATVERLRKLIDAARELRSPQLISPNAVVSEGPTIAVVSRLVVGEDARTRLARQGRFPAAAVAEIARQLLVALDDARRVGLPHGDVSLRNVRLSTRGEATLVAHGIRPAVTPSVSIHDALPAERYDGLAPERIGTGGPATIAADLFALGCLLWQLLAGRPPFPIGEPLARLSAYATRPVPDVRDFAPDAPPALLALIRELTARDPAARPSEPLDAARRLRSAIRSGRAIVRRGHAVETERGGVWPIAATALFALAGAGVAFSDAGDRAAFLLTKPSAPRTVTAAVPASEAAPNALAELPAPDGRGVLRLEQAGPFAAAAVAFRGPLVIRGPADRPAVIVVGDVPLHLRADDVTLENVIVRQAPAAGLTAGPTALVLAESQNLTLDRCRIDGDAAAGRAIPAVAWRMIDRADPTAGRVTLRDAAVGDVREAVYLADPPRRLSIENTLIARVGGVATLRTAVRPVATRLKNVTVRDAAFVIGVRDAANGAAVTVTADDTALELVPDAALFAVAGGGATDLRWSGSGVVTTGELRPVRRADGGSPVPEAAVEGLTRAAVAFAGPAEGSPAASVANVVGLPRRAGHSLGVDPSRLLDRGDATPIAERPGAAAVR